MIVKIIFEGLEGDRWAMLFGNSYKDWKTQFEEYLWDQIRWWDSKIILKCNIYKITAILSSKDKWIQSGGLKWCNETEAQSELNKEAELLNLKKPRQYTENFNLKSDPGKLDFCKNKLAQRLRHLNDAGQEQIINELKKQESNCGENAIIETKTEENDKQNENN